MKFLLIQALILTFRDLKAKELNLLIISLVISVSSLSAVNFFTERMNDHLLRDASGLIGADLVIRGDYPLNLDWKNKAISLGLEVAENITFPSMISFYNNNNSESKLVSVKAVSENYPLRGSMTLFLNGKSFVRKGGPKEGIIWIDKNFIDSIRLNTSKKVKLGDKFFSLGPSILIEQDRGTSFINFAPRVMLSIKDLPKTKLIQDGSRVSYRFQFSGEPKIINSFKKWIQNDLQNKPVQGVKIESINSESNGIQLTIKKASQFLTIISLLTTLLSSLSIVMAARIFVNRHIQPCAMFRCFGLRQSEIAQIFFIEFFIIGLLSGIIGSFFGWLIHLCLIELLADFFADNLPSINLNSFFRGVLIGLFLLMCFALQPIYKLSRVSFKNIISIDLYSIKFSSVITNLLNLVLFLIFLIWISKDIYLGVLVATSFVTLMIFSVLFTLFILKVLHQFNFQKFLTLNFVKKSLKRRAFMTAFQISSLSIGICAILVITVVSNNLLDYWKNSTSSDTPNHFIINVQSDQRNLINKELKKNNMEKINFNIMIRGRLININDSIVKVSDYKNKRSRGLIEREFNLSTMTEVPQGNKIIKGKWFKSKSDFGEASVEKGVAKSLNLKLNDILIFNVAGEKIRVKITSIRELKWSSMNVNFFVIINPFIAKNLPGSWITAFHLPEENKELVQKLVSKNPNITVVDIGLMVNQFKKITNKIIIAVEFLFIFTLFACIVLLSTTMISSQKERLFENSILRILGTTNFQLIKSQFFESLFIGFLSGIASATIATFLSWLLANQIFEISWSFSINLWIWSMLLSFLCSLVGCWFGLKAVIFNPPINSIRMS